jgi:hypothetical protein
MDSTDWKAVCDSEIFREYVKAELAKEEQVKLANEKANDTSILFDEFKALEQRINGNLKVKKAFKEFKDRLMVDPEFAKKANQKLAEVVMMLDLGD